MRYSRSALLPSSNLLTSNSSTLILCILIFSSFSLAAAPDRIAGMIDSSQTIALAKSHHPKAQPQYDRGPVDPSFKLSYITLLIAPSASQQKALDRLLAQQQDPSSPLYHQWLTPQQYADRFGLSQNDLGKVTTWLKSEGFQVISVGGGRSTVIFSGTAAQAQHAFGTEIHNYDVNGEQHFASSTPVRMPAALNGIVKGVMGLHDFRAIPANRGGRPGGTRIGRPDYYDGSFLFPNFLAPDDIATIYDIAKLYNLPSAINGAGEKLAIVGQTDIYLADLIDFRTGFNLPAISASNCTLNSSGVITACNDPFFQYVVVGSDPGVPSSGDLSESDLDIEWSGATARNAQIIFVNGETSGGVYDALTAVIDPPVGPPLAPVVSMSYGYCEIGAPDLESPPLKQGNAEGVTILNSAGDQASAACDYSPPGTTSTFTPPPPFSAAQFGLAVSYPASSPEVTGVGGTAISLADDSYPTQSSFWSTTLGPHGGTAQSYIPELAWNDDEEFALFCQSDPSSTFCKQGNFPPVTGWVPLTATATPAQVQSDIWIDGGGGGASNCWYLDPTGTFCLGAGPGPTSGGGFAQPTYQQGLAIPNAPAGVRYVPDVSLLAAPNFPGYIFCTAQSELFQGGTSASSCANGISGALDNSNYTSVIGGTSASSPIFAGIVTLLNQYVVHNGIQPKPGLGNINQNLYYLAAYSPSAFNQVTTGDNMVYCQETLPTGFPPNVVCPAAGVFGFQASDVDSAVGTGYNLVTGLGSVDAYNLLQAWASSTAAVFTLAVPPPNPDSTPVNTPVSWNGTLFAMNGYNRSVSLTCVGEPTTETCAIAPTSVTPTTAGATFQVTASSGTAGIYDFTITASDGTLSHSHLVSLTVNPDFTVPANLTAPTAANPGQTTSTSMALAPIPAGGSFTGNVTYTCSAGLPLGASCSFSPAQINGGSAQSVTITVQTAGPFTGTAGSARPGLRAQGQQIGRASCRERV